jgi:hypothetical protein
LAKEKEMTSRDALNAERRRLPMVKIKRDYIFKGAHGKRPCGAAWSPNLDFVHSVHTLEDMSSAYVSGRVPTRYERLVTKQARAARTSKSDLVARYVIEKSLEPSFLEFPFATRFQAAKRT